MAMYHRIPKNEYYLFTRIEDLPDDIKDHTVYVIGEKGHEWLAALKCPCGCGDTLQLNLIKAVKPKWRIFFHKKRKVSISPSIDRIVNCRSHFTLTKGIVRWWGEKE
jgi:Family of unknown function (DUF6527)